MDKDKMRLLKVRPEDHACERLTTKMKEKEETSGGSKVYETKIKI